ncbi:uncharacterized protein RJT20DRAFT_128944 [Scheffersomyces xylosifermentans]|uniref:uncharacterized protein n=1 Tax=Scheffersomyces xylosifermentans TaxID=1304137 RepID=UPI00315CCCEE
MKVLSDKDIVAYLDSKLTQKSILEDFQPALVNSLRTYGDDPNKIVPPRIAQVSNNEKSDTTHLFMPCISPDEVGIKVISGGQGNNAKGLGFQGCVLIMDEITGSLKAVLNAGTLTAFRTALASTLGLTKVISVDKDGLLPEVAVFGVGAQAYWHVKLTLILYQGKFTTVNILNRTLKNAEALAATLSSEFKDIKFNSYSYQDPEVEQDLTDHVRNSSVIFGCTPSTVPIIKKDYINSNAKYPKFISLIGSYKPHMIELDLAIVEELKTSGVSIIVDSKEHTLHEAGELIQGDITENELIEIPDLYVGEISSSTFTLASSNLTVQKLVGLSIMDLSVGKYISEDAGDVGVDIPDF